MVKDNMLEKFLKQTEFKDYADFMANFKVEVPEDFNFGYDVVDAYAETDPEKEAILWTNDRGDVKHINYSEYKRLSDAVASYFQTLDIGKGDCVMLILKRRVEWWITMVALHKIGAVAIPATHLLTDKDIIYRCHQASVKAIVAVGDTIVLRNVIRARGSPTQPYMISQSNVTCIGRWKWSFGRENISTPSAYHFISFSVQRNPYSW